MDKATESQGPQRGQEAPLDMLFNYESLLHGFPFEVHPALDQIGRSFKLNLDQCWSVDGVISEVMRVSYYKGIASVEESLKGSGYELAKYIQHARSKLVNVGEVINDASFGHSAVYHILCGQVVGLWTAFEAMCTDLWLAAVNASPKILGKNAFYFKVKPQVASDGSVAAGTEIGRERDAKGIPFHLLEDFEYDLSCSMGDYIKATKKFDFNRLSGLRIAFNAAFGKDIDKQLWKEVFEDKSEQGIVALELIRNVTVHRAGRIDRRFLIQAFGIGDLCQLKVGDAVSLDREKVRKFNSSVLRKDVNLAAFVNDWLKANSP